MGLKLPDAFHDAMANPPRTEFDDWSDRFSDALRDVAGLVIPMPESPPGGYGGPTEGCGDFFGEGDLAEPDVAYHELSEGELNAMRQGADIMRVGVGPQPFNASTFPGATRRFPPVVSADETNYATLTIGGVAAPVRNVVFYDDVDVSIDGIRVDGADVPLSPSPIVLTTYGEWTPAFQAWHDRIMTAPMLASPRRPWRRGANHPGEAPRWYRLRTKRHEKATAKRTKVRAARYAARWEQAHLRDKPPPRDYRAERQSLARELAESVERIGEKFGVGK